MRTPDPYPKQHLMQNVTVSQQQQQQHHRQQQLQQQHRLQQHRRLQQQQQHRQQHQQHPQHQPHHHQQQQKHQEQRRNQQLQQQHMARQEMLSTQNLFMQQQQVQPLQQAQRPQHPQQHAQPLAPEPQRLPLRQQPAQTSVTPVPSGSSWVQQWQQYPPNPVTIAQQYTDFWAVLRLSALAREWTFPTVGRAPTRAPQTQLSRGVVSMYICAKAHCATSLDRTVLHRSAGILVPVEVGDGVVVGHFFEKIWTPHSGSHKESFLQGKYIMCTRTREVLKIMGRPEDGSGLMAQSLCIDRSVMISEGVFLRDFVVVSIPHRHPAGTIPEQFAVTMRTTVMHNSENGVTSGDGAGAASTSQKEPFIPLDMDVQTAAEVAINPSHGFHGFGIYNMTITPSWAGIDINSGHAPHRALGLLWTPPIHVANCSQPVWSLRQLNRNDASELRGLFNATYAREQAFLQSRISSGMNMPVASSGQALKVTGEGMVNLRQGRGKTISEDESRVHSQLHTSIPHQLFQISMPMVHMSPSHLNYSTGQPSVPIVSSPFAASSVAQPTLAQPSLAQPSLAQPSLAQPSLTQPSLAQTTLVQPPLAQPTLVQPALAPHSPVIPRMSTQLNLSPAPLGDTRRNIGIEPAPGMSNFGVRQIYSDPSKAKTQAALATTGAGPSTLGPVKTFRGTRRKNEALPAPTEKEVIMRNRISAQKSNEKRRKKLDAMKLEVAYLQEKLIPRLEMAKLVLQNENRKLISKFSETFNTPIIASFHSHMTGTTV